MAACNRHDHTATRDGSVEHQWHQRHFGFVDNVTEVREAREDAVLGISSRLTAEYASNVRHCDSHLMSEPLPGTDRFMQRLLCPMSPSAIEVSS